jgi:hypothetical protein
VQLSSSTTSPIDELKFMGPIGLTNFSHFLLSPQVGTIH